MISVIDNDVWENLTNMFVCQNKENIQNKQNKNQIINKLYEISYKYNIEIKNLIKDYINYIVRHKSSYVNSNFLEFVEFIMHINEPNINYLIHYTVLRLTECINI